jgi:hypothetical protein
MSPAARLLLQAQLVFWGCVLVCFLVTGGGLSHNHGFSVYGGRWETIVPWTVGFVAASVLILRAAALLDHDDPPFAWGLRLVVLFGMGILFTPDTIDQFFYVAHIVASVFLFLFQAILGLWLVWRSRAPQLVGIYVAQIAGGLVAGASQAQWIGLLSIGIFTFQVAFGALIVLASAEESYFARRASSSSTAETSSPREASST